ncbi:tyrosine-type recombinase/integrase [Candidatus Palauibacter sp.]|uniref:tyrosine-type recombinase/integrase n=1 Tax=Candidatus Palauibacter sp. TaxID=3101350 RepID=UPI003B5A1B7D
MAKLTAAFVKTVRHSGKPSGPDKYTDQHGLMLRVLPSGSKQWIWRGTVRGRRLDLGLGGYPYTTLAEARETAFEYRKLSRAGGDPRALKQEMPNFEQAAETVIAIHRASWRAGGKSEAQWRSSLATYVYPCLGRKRVDAITTADVMAVLLPIWSTKRETARRVRQRIGAVMKWAVAQGYRADNPAGDAIGAALPKNGGLRKHFEALPHGEVRAALDRVRNSGAYCTTRLCFEFVTLTAVRGGEARQARWGEIDLENRVWTIPAERMKAGQTHRVPLSKRALEVLEEARKLADGSGLVFPSLSGQPLNPSTLSKLSRSLGLEGTMHGMRSAFRDWCSETGVPREVAEAALAHTVRDKVEAAYRRTDLFERRRELMEEWSTYVAQA